MKTILIAIILCCITSIACNNDETRTNKVSTNNTHNKAADKTEKETEKETESEEENENSKATDNAIAGRHYTGTFSNGMKGNKISFDISGDGTQLLNLTFMGYWHCDGKLEQTTVGPDGAFTIVDNKVNQHISEPPNGGSTAWRFDLNARLNGSTASGTFRMNINNLGCDSYLLKWTATAE